MQCRLRWPLMIPIFFVLTGWATASDVHSPRTAALGGSGHAGPMLNDAIYLNPAYASLAQTYSVSFSYLKFSGDSIQNAQGQTLGNYGRNYTVSILDGRSELFQAGASYTRRESGGLLHIGASKSFIERTGIGVGGKFFFPNDESKKSIQDATASAAFLATPWLQTVLVVDNLLQSEAGKSQNFYREYILGAKFLIMGIMMIYFDPHWIPDIPSGSEFGIEGGLEFAVLKDLFLRVGHFRQANIPYYPAYGEGFGLGAGWIGPRLSIDYGMERVTATTTGLPPETAHTLGMSIYF